MRILLLALFVLSTNNIFGQSIDGSIIKCMYELKYTKDTLTKQMNEDLLILQVGRILSKSYSFYSNQVDSIFGLPNKDEVLRRAINKAFETNAEHPHKRMKTYVYKNYPVGKITVTDGLSLQDYIYEDELNAQDWEILDSTRMVLDNLCQLAKCTFRGRQWMAWFAPEIPISDGPWKFGGLPGLIMEVYDIDRQYNFVIIGLEKKEEPIVFSKTYIGNKKFEKTNRLEFLKAKKSYLMNMGGYIEMETGIDLGGNSSQKIMRYDLIERDY
jgi:GLPGLI family protein